MAELRLRAAVSTRDSELQSKIPPLMNVCMLVFGDQEEEHIAIWRHQRKGEEVMPRVESSHVVMNLRHWFIRGGGDRRGLFAEIIE